MLRILGFALLAGLVFAEGAVLSPALSEQMAQKLAQIEQWPSRPRRTPLTTTFSEAEVDSYFLYKMSARVPKGVSEVRFQFQPDRVTATAMIDFDQVKAASRKPVNPLVDLLLNGRKPVSVTGRFTSAAGSGTFFVEEVSVGSLALRGFLLDLVIRNYVLPRYPQAAIGQPFTLPAQIDQLVLMQNRAVIYQR